MVQIHDSTSGIFPASFGRQNPHVTSQNYVIDLVLVAEFYHACIVGHAVFVADLMPVEPELLGQQATMGPAAKHHSRFGRNSLIANRPQ